MKCMRRWMLVALWGGASLASAAERVAVAVFANENSLQRYEKAVQGRMEELLREAGLETVDEKEAAKIKRNWADHIEPGVLMTAEEYSKRVERLNIKKVYRVSFGAGMSNAMGLFYSATGNVQVSVVGALAAVQSYTSKPMGVRGFPPSDALTQDAALVNALQRAVEGAAEQAGIPVLAPVTARYIPLKLSEVPALAASATELVLAARPTAAGWDQYAQVLSEKWRKEEPSCQSVSPDGAFGVLGTQAWDRANGRPGGERRYGGYLHVVDLGARREMTKLTLHELGLRERGENGPSAALACSFLGNWRYLIAASGNKLACFDIERGLQTCDLPVSGAPEAARLQFWQDGPKRYVQLSSDKGRQTFELSAGH
ncbi:MAG: hypothetical protein ACEQSK_16220 [Sphingomonadaceae bacterium]